ncbi:hypothetical protein [Weissella cibaria]|uniref:hypothetical protein n=1 Tax=Weissella cibaria TaxID=137591 RepID=UPI00223C0B5F|nr:hypothetical protein [Weissella cibaria]MCT0019974.1 hypothetical protein [Weissella cibaria]
MKKAIFSGMIAISSLAMFAGQANVSAKTKYKPVPKVTVTYRMVDSRTGSVLSTQKVTYNKNAKAVKSYSAIYGYNTPRTTNFKVAYSQTKTIGYTPKQFTVTNRFYNTVTHMYLANKTVRAYYNQNFNDAPTVAGYIRPAAQRFVVKGNVTRTFNVLANKGTLQNPVAVGITTTLDNNSVGFVNDQYNSGVVKLKDSGYRATSTRTMNDYLAYNQQHNYSKWRSSYLFGAQRLTLPAGNAWLSVPVDNIDTNQVLAIRLSTKDGANVMSPLSVQSDQLMYLNGHATLTTKLYGNDDNIAWTEGGYAPDFYYYINNKADKSLYFRVPNTVMTQDLRVGFQLRTGQWIYYRPSATSLY